LQRVRLLSSTQYELPEIRLDHIRYLTDDTGIIQHAPYGVPDRQSGYSTDDAARALIVALLYNKQLADKTALDLATCYLSFLKYAQLPDGHFHNFMSYNRDFLDKRGSVDTFVRALWALGTTIACAPNDSMRALAREMFERAINAIELEHLRAMAYSICGLYSVLERYDGATQVRRRLIEVAEQLADLFERSPPRPGTGSAGHEYANARMPRQGLLIA
jgi:hypothetical protein